MIQALRIIDIAKAHTTKDMKVSRSRVQYHCRKMKIQQVILPIKKLYPDQANQVTMYLDGFKVVKDGEMVNPIRLIAVPDDKVDPRTYDVWAMYWNKARYYRLPKGCEILAMADPITKLPELKKFAAKKYTSKK